MLLYCAMCGRFTLTANIAAIAKRFSVAVSASTYSPRYNIAPTQNVIVVGDDGKRYLTTMHWGLIPSWAKDPTIGNRMINARCETVAEKPSFRKALRERRCLIVADGFYEWQQEGTSKQPVRIVLKSGESFGFAGLWDTWTSPEGEVIRSCTIVTTNANEVIRPIHDRMPVILPENAEGVWLDPKIQDPAVLLPLLKPYPSDEMLVYPVGRIVNSPRIDTPECVVPIKQAKGVYHQSIETEISMPTGEKTKSTTWIRVY